MARNTAGPPRTAAVSRSDPAPTPAQNTSVVRGTLDRLLGTANADRAGGSAPTRSDRSTASARSALLAVVERLVLLAPVAGIGQPRILGRKLRRIVRHHLDGGVAARATGRACCHSRPRPPRLRRGTEPAGSSRCASPRPGTRPGACRRPSRAWSRPTRPARRRRAGCYPTAEGATPSAAFALAAGKSSWIISQSPSCLLLKSFKM